LTIDELQGYLENRLAKLDVAPSEEEVGEEEEKSDSQDFAPCNK